MLQAGDTVKCFSEYQLDEYIRAYRNLGYAIKKDSKNCMMIIVKGIPEKPIKERKPKVIWNNKKEGARLKYMREAIYFLIKEVADEVGVSRQEVRDWESGKKMPTGETLKRLCELFECDEEYITKGIGTWVIQQ